LLPGEDDLKLQILIRTSALLICMVCLVPLAAQQPEPPPKPPEFPSPPAAARIWKSQTTGKEYRVWTENQRLRAEWVNAASVGAQRPSIRIECQRIGEKWVGTARNYLPCETTENGKRLSNWCRLTTKIEFDSPEANRMTGHTEWAHRFDCVNCKILEPVWKDFEWVPKEQTPVPMKK